MSWNRFHFFCREYHQRLKHGMAQDQAYESALDHEQSLLYGPLPKKNSLQAKLTEHLYQLKHTERALAASAIYGDLRFTSLHHGADKCRRSLAYLCLLIAQYIVLASLYKTAVIPHFLDVFESSDTLSAPSYLLWYSLHSDAITLSLLSMLTFTTLTTYMLKQAAHFRVDPVPSVLFKILIPRHIKQSYHRLITLLHHPLSHPLDGRIADLPVTSHLNRLIHDPEQYKTEWNAIYDETTHQFQTSIHVYSRTLLLISATTIIGSIGLFVMVIYQSAVYGGSLS